MNNINEGTLLKIMKDKNNKVVMFNELICVMCMEPCW